jgi:transcription factor C subunit 6
MLERFFPLVRFSLVTLTVVLISLQEAQDRPTQAKALRTERAKNRDNTYVAPTGTGAWPKEIGVQRVVWNCGNGFAASALLASSTGSGLCRVDMVWGRWLNDRIPYTSVEDMRMEVEGARDVGMDVDSEESA